MIVEQGNIWSRLVTYTPAERRWVDEYTSIEEPGRFYAGQWGGNQDERYRMLHLISCQFPSGFTRMMAKKARQLGIECQVVDLRGPPPCGIEDMADLDWLRDYQLAAVWAAVEAGRGLIKVPTGGGKTEIFIGMTRALPCEWLFAVHRSDLTGQAAKRYALRTGETAGVFEAGAWKRGSANVTVATFQGIYSAMKKQPRKAHKKAPVWDFLDKVRALNTDEVHAQPADSFYKVAMSMPNCYYRFGQSGTPLDRGPKDSLRTIASIGPMVYKISNDVLERAGVLSKPKIYMVPLKQAGGTDCDWQTAYSQLIVNSTVRNDLLAQMAEMATKPCLLFVDQMAQGEELVQRISRLGMRVDFAHGSHWTKARLDMIERLVQAKLDVLVCSIIFQEGIDIPTLESVINGGGKASVVGSLQRIGRGMRTAKGKTGFEVWDVHDRGQRWIQNHAAARLKAYRKEGHEIVFGWPGHAVPEPVHDVWSAIPEKFWEDLPNSPKTP